MWNNLNVGETKSCVLNVYLLADLSEPARYAYASLFALIWKSHYGDESDREFRNESVHQLLQHLQLLEVHWSLLHHTVMIQLTAIKFARRGKRNILLANRHQNERKMGMIVPFFSPLVWANHTSFDGRIGSLGGTIPSNNGRGARHESRWKFGDSSRLEVGVT